jgi:uncharacterized glyoxalase superfamily protein PhnB
MSGFEPYLDPVTDENASPTFGDYGKTAAASLTGGVLAPTAALTRATTEQGQNPTSRFVNAMSKVLQQHLNETTEDINESRTDVARKRAEAAVTSPDFWEHPVSASMLKATGIAAPAAAAIFSGGAVGAALVGGALATGSYENEIDRSLDATADADLRQNAYYDSLRQMGMGEDEARSMLKRKIIGNKDLLNFVVGSVAGAIGPAGKVAAGVAGKGAIGLASEEAGVGARAALGAAEGAVGGAAQGGVENATVQQSQLEAGLKKQFDDTALVNAVLEPGLIGGIAGGVAGAAVGGKGKAKAEAIKAKQPEPEVSLNEQTAQPPKQSGSGTPIDPVEAAPEIGNPNSAPTRSPTDYPKSKAGSKARGKKAPVIETVEPAAPSIAEAAAIADLQQKPATEAQAPEVPSPVAEAAQRVARPVQPEQPTPQSGVPAPVVAPEPVAPPEVAAASRRVEPTQITPEVTQPQATPDVRVPEIPAPANTAPVQVEIAPEAPKAVATPEPVKPVASAEVKAAEPVKRTGRVLQVIKDKAAQEAEAKAAKEAFRKANKNAKEVAEFEANPEPISKGKNWTKAEKEARAASGEAAKKIFDEHVPEEAEIPTTPQGREELRTRLGKMIEAADAAGVKVPAKVGYEGTSDHVVYMRAAKDLHKKLGQKSFTGTRRDKQIADFMVAERAARRGDFSVLRETRKVEGDLAMRKEQGDVEQKAAGGTAGAEAEAEPVHTAVPKSARGPVRDSGSEGKAASSGKVLEGEAKAKAIAELNARMAKGKVDITATRTEAPKPKPPEATSAKVVDKAAKKTNTNPTEAQKEAGNYKKAVVRWHGLDIAIENPKGSVRRGKGANGKEWSVEMPEHYGYVRRSEGADGDQVDIYMGPHPDSDQVFVIHQQDFDGKFDEHKVMLGFRSNADALQAYDRAFSDGRGFERIKDIEIMTAQEFKDWVRSDKPKKAAKAGEEVLSEALTDTGVRNKFNPKKTVQALKTLKAKEALDSLDLSHLTGVPKAMGDLMLNRLKALVGDVDVHIVNKEQMAQVSGDVATAFADDPLVGTRGLHNLSVDKGKSDVFIRTDNLDNPEHTAHAVIHEIVHAATSRAMYEDPRLSMTVKQMMEETKAHLLKHSGKEHYDELAAVMKYAFSNTHEFVAEAMSNPKVQDFLATVPMSRELSAALRMPAGHKMSLWDAFVHVVRKALEKSIGRVPQGERMIEGIVRLGTQFERAHKDVQRRRAAGEPVPVNLVTDPRALTEHLVGEAKERVQKWAEDRAKVQDQEGKPWLLKARTMDQIAQAAEHYFGSNNPVRKVADTIERMRVKAVANLKKSEPIVDKLYSLEKKYKASGVWQKFVTLVHDETMSGVFSDRDLASQAHLGKDALKGKWAKAQHADLAARFAELPEDLRQARTEAMTFFAKQQNAMSLGVIKNRVLKALGVEDDELARRIHEGRTTDADGDLLGEQTLELIKEAKELSQIQGPYFPLMRRGSHVVRATYDVAAPAGAKKLSDNEFEFAGKDARDRAIAYAEQQDTRPEIKSVWVDPATGETHYPDGTKVTANDVQSEQRFRVVVQQRHVEFFDSAREAQAAAYELAKEGLHVQGVEERRFEGGENRDLLSHQMATLVASLEKRKGYQDMTADQRRELKGALTEASLRFLGSTRIQSKRLPRRYVEGASQDLTRNTLDYAQSTAGYLAKLEHQPELEAAMKEMRDAVTQDNSKNKSLARSSIANEIEQRVAKANVFDEGGSWNSITKRVMTLSFMDKLFSPAYNVVNSLQPAMVTMPTLAGRYGVGRSFDALSRAYRDVSGFGLIKAGVRDTISKAKNAQGETTDLLSQIKQGLSSKERAMLDYLAERGSIDPEAGMEVSRLIKSRAGAAGKLDTGLGYMEGIARQMPQAIEMMNRSVTALATYRLEIARGAGHEKAMAKAQELVNNTQGLYSATNQAPLFNHPVAKLSLQFKKFAQSMYHLIGMNIGKALRNAEPGDRAEALKTLAGLTATHVAMAGALGLPTEPFKYLLMGAQAAGLTSTGWSDVENAVREKASNWFGKTAGELVTKGLPRAIGVDLSSRVGLDSLSSFGEPRSNKEADIKKWAFDTIAGAPIALVGDWIKGMNELTAGNFTKAAELLVPMKFAADSIRAYRQMSEGRKGSTGKETMSPYSVREAVTRAAGFTPAREAEQSAMNSAFYSASRQDKDERSRLMSSWASAKPSDKPDAWKKIQSFNKGKSRDQQISMQQLTSYADRRKKEGNSITTTRRDKDFLKTAQSTYNP